jgi:hypothetical protein
MCETGLPRTETHPTRTWFFFGMSRWRCAENCLGASGTVTSMGIYDSISGGPMDDYDKGQVLGKGSTSLVFEAVRKVSGVGFPASRSRHHGWLPGGPADERPSYGVNIPCPTGDLRIRQAAPWQASWGASAVARAINELVLSPGLSPVPLCVSLSLAPHAG